MAQPQAMERTKAIAIRVKGGKRFCVTIVAEDIVWSPHRRCMGAVTAVDRKGYWEMRSQEGGLPPQSSLNLAENKRRARACPLPDCRFPGKSYADSKLRVVLIKGELAYF